MTTSCAVTKQFGSTMPSSPHILAAETGAETIETRVYMIGFLILKKRLSLTDYVVSRLLADGNGPHSIWRDVLGEDDDCIFLYTWKTQAVGQPEWPIFYKGHGRKVILKDKSLKQEQYCMCTLKGLLIIAVVPLAD